MQVFENSIFLFQNVFYVGETISIEGTRYNVNSVTLLKVHLTRVDGADVTIPTSEMTRMRLHNITRSQPLWEGIHVAVDMDTPVAALHCVAFHVVAAMRLHPKLFGGDYRVWFADLVAGHKKEVVLWFNHAGPGVCCACCHWLAMHVITLLCLLGAGSCCAIGWRRSSYRKHLQPDQERKSERP